MAGLSDYLDRDYVTAGFEAVGDNLNGVGAALTALYLASEAEAEAEDSGPLKDIGDAFASLIAARDCVAQLARYLNVEAAIASTPEIKDLGSVENP